MYEFTDATHRDVEYRIRQIGPASWRWICFPGAELGRRRYGVSGSEAEAMVACFGAIDAMIDEAAPAAA